MYLTDWDLEAEREAVMAEQQEERAAESEAPTLGATVRTTRAIGSMPAGTIGRVIRRNCKSVTIAVPPNGVATVPLDAYAVI